MAQLRRDHQKFIDRTTEVIAVGPEQAKPFTKWWHEHKMPFTGIPDPEHTIAEGLYHQQSKIFKGGRMPALAVLDRDLKVRFMHYADSMSDIPTNEDVLSLLDKLNQEQGT